MCIFAIAPTRVLAPNDMSDLLAAVTGWETSPYEMMRFGERPLHLMRLYNLRQGITAANDTLPDRFFDDPLDCQDRLSGVSLDRGKFHQAILTWYGMMGCDENGFPATATLLDFDLHWATEYLQT